jgi:hypothetical protein
MDIAHDSVDQALVEPQDRVLGRSTLAALLGLLLACYLFAIFAAPRTISRPFMLFCVLGGLGTLALQIVFRAVGPKPVNWVSVDILFMLGFCVVHFVYPLFWLLGIVPGSELVWINPEVVCSATAMAVSALLAFALGCNSIRERYNRRQYPVSLNADTLLGWKLVGRVLFLAAIVAMAIYLYIMGSRLTVGPYAGLNIQEYGENVVFLLLRILVSLGFLYLTIGAAQLTGKWKIGWVTKLSFFLYVVWIMILGHRTLAVEPLVLVLAAYSEHVKQISFKKLVGLVLAGLLILSVVRAGRQSETRTPTAFLREVKRQREEIGLRNTLVGFGGSVRTLYAAANEVPKNRYYLLGRLKLSGLAAVVPFSRRLLPRRLEYTSSAWFLTWIIQQDLTLSGVGTTVVADVYLDFGLPGVIIGLFGLGVLVKHVEQKARGTASMAWAVAHATLIPLLAIMPRYTITIIGRGVLWPVFLTLLLSPLLRRDQAAWDNEAAESA